MNAPLRSAMGLVALAYARRGWPVFPLHEPDRSGSCSCGRLDCARPGKHPRTRHGLHDASTDPLRIRAWWALWPEANVGLRMGQGGTGAWALDIDPRHGGEASLAALEAEHGPLPRTRRVRTGSGGEHVWFDLEGHAIGNRIGLLPGVDGRGDGGYLVAPPSRHASGGRYVWRTGHGPLQAPLAPMPPWLRALLEPPPPRLPAPPRVLGTHLDPGERARRYLERVEPAIQGCGGDAHTYRVVARVARGFGLGELEALTALAGWNARCQPPWTVPALRQKVQNALRYGKEPLGQKLGKQP